MSGNASENFVVHKNAVLEFTQETWTNILNILNTALGRTDGNKLVYDAENTNNDGAVVAAGTKVTEVVVQDDEQGDIGTPTLIENQETLKTSTETLMSSALGDGKVILKGEKTMKMEM